MLVLARQDGEGLKAVVSAPSVIVACTIVVVDDDDDGFYVGGRGYIHVGTVHMGTDIITLPFGFMRFREGGQCEP